MKKLALLVVVVLIAVGVGGYYYLSGKELVIRLSEAELQQKLSEKLPLTKNYLFIFQVTLDRPRLMLQSGSDRVRAGLDVVLNITIDNNPTPLGGAVDVSAGVEYRPENGEFYLSDPIVEQFDVQGVPEKYASKVNKALSKALGEYYQKHPIYSLANKDAKHAFAKLVLKSVIVKDQELVITLGV